VENQTAYALADENDYRHLGLAQLGIALAYHQKAYIRQVFRDPATAQILYEKALESYSACIALAAEDTFDWFLQAFMQEQCTPGRRDVEDELTRLREESHGQKWLNYIL
jgi:hypothetical protein